MLCSNTPISGIRHSYFKLFNHLWYPNRYKFTKNCTVLLEISVFDALYVMKSVEFVVAGHRSSKPKRLERPAPITNLRTVNKGSTKARWLHAYGGAMAHKNIDSIVTGFPAMRFCSLV
jgi:hypothetical protein